MRIELTKRDIAELIDEQVSKIQAIQMIIGKIFYPYREDMELMKILSEDYGNLEYIQSCVRVYKGSLLIEY